MDQVLSLRFHSAVNEDIFGQIGATYRRKGKGIIFLKE